MKFGQTKLALYWVQTNLGFFTMRFLHCPHLHASLVRAANSIWILPLWRGMHFFWINFFGSTGWDVDAKDANFRFLNLVQNFNKRGKPPGTGVEIKSPCAEDNFTIFTTSIIEVDTNEIRKCCTVNNFFWSLLLEKFWCYQNVLFLTRIQASIFFHLLWFHIQS